MLVELGIAVLRQHGRAGELQPQKITGSNNYLLPYYSITFPLENIPFQQGFFSFKTIIKGLGYRQYGKRIKTSSTFGHFYSSSVLLDLFWHRSVY